MRVAAPCLPYRGERMSQGRGCPYHAGHESRGYVKMISCKKLGGDFEIIAQYTKADDYITQLECYCKGQECTYKYCEIYLALNGWKDVRQNERPIRLSRYDTIGPGKTLQVYKGRMSTKALPPRRAAEAPGHGPEGRGRAENRP